ncbi:hypothetical protein M3P21_11885 [Ruegeria sp. 2012CJ41-6]|uniref:Tat pathway signal sequence domain protein n=1 Tax=Ruegeria spongiae TaxID=2942209 RepID=A0ABT0Q351_9RHOB|nr:hypothetical protein [Ruegeria spongiae]MCL6284227.1 hypothetical protein [Ruegeria spongiae]
MLFLRIALVLSASVFPLAVLAQSADGPASRLSVELNAVQDVGEACRLSFLVENLTGTTIDEAVLETVIFDTAGGVVTLSLFDFRDLPVGRPRVRQFDLPGMACNAVGRALINGSSSCIVNGAESGVCQEALSLSSRVDVELLG